MSGNRRQPPHPPGQRRATTGHRGQRRKGLVGRPGSRGRRLAVGDTFRLSCSFRGSESSYRCSEGSDLGSEPADPVMSGAVRPWAVTDEGVLGAREVVTAGRAGTSPGPVRFWCGSGRRVETWRAGGVRRVRPAQAAPGSRTRSSPVAAPCRPADPRPGAARYRSRRRACQGPVGSPQAQATDRLRPAAQRLCQSDRGPAQAPRPGHLEARPTTACPPQLRCRFYRHSPQATTAPKPRHRRPPRANPLFRAPTETSGEPDFPGSRRLPGLDAAGLLPLWRRTANGIRSTV